MDAAHLHLALNHAPLFGVLFAILGLAWAFARQNDGVARASLALLVLAGLLVVPTYLTGEEAEEVIEERVGASEVAIEAHEDAALGGAIAVGVVGLAALIVLVGFRSRNVPRAATATVLVLALAAAAWIGYVANLGGQISHPEIRSATTVQAGGDFESGDYDD
jgi:uncharacterized membrane protein